MSSNFPSRLYIRAKRIDSHIESITSSIQKLVFSGIHKKDEDIKKRRVVTSLVVIFLFSILGAVISNKGIAEITVFHPTSCLGGWINPRNAEGEPQIKSNESVDLFSKDNSAFLSPEAYADIYCGNFVGEIDQNTKPVKMILSFSWSAGGEYTLEKEIISDSFASSTLEIIDTASSAEVSFTLSSSTENISTSTELNDQNISSTTLIQLETKIESSEEIKKEESVIDKAIDTINNVVEKIINNEEVKKEEGVNTPEAVVPSESTTQTENVIPVNQIQQEQAPVIDTPAVDNSSNTEIPPQSYFFDGIIDLVTNYFFEKVFAEETVSTENLFSTSSIDSKPDLISPTTTLEYFSTSTDLSLIGTSSAADSTSTDILVNSTTTSTSTEESLTSKNSGFLEILYTFDGTNWNTLDVVSESQMKYRTFEIPISTSTSWSDMNQLQIKIQKIANIDKTPAIYLDGIRVEVLYETIVTHKHPDFTRDTILKDEIVDGIRMVTIINSDNNQEEIWYLVQEDFSSNEIVTSTSTLNSSSTDIATSSLDIVNSTSTIKTIESGSTTTLNLTEVSSSTKEISTSTEKVATSTILKTKNIWIKYDGIKTENLTVADIIQNEEKKLNQNNNQEEALEENKEEEKILDILPDFLSDSIKRIKGNLLNTVIIQVKRGDKDELWLYNLENDSKEKISSNSTTTVASDFPIGIKSGYLFWLSEDKKNVFAYNPTNKNYINKEVPIFDKTKGERAEIFFDEIGWKIIVNEEGFSFFSQETGEVFSDEDNIVQDTIRKKFNLDTVLNAEKLNQLDFSVEVSPQEE